MAKVETSHPLSELDTNECRDMMSSKDFHTYLTGNTGMQGLESLRHLLVFIGLSVSVCRDFPAQLTNMLSP